MSQRSIVEINHDYIWDLEKDGHLSHEFAQFLTGGSDGRERNRLDVRGIRYLGQRHHSETLKLEVR